MVDGVNIGNFADGNRGIRVSDAGYDGDSNPCDQSRLAFSTEWPTCLPIFWQSGNVAFSAGSTTTISFPSTLGYTPMISVMITAGGVTYAPNMHESWSSSSSGVYAQAMTIQIFPGYVTVAVGSGWTAMTAGGGNGTATSGTIRITVYRVGLP
jgi:hypothetical protein